MLTIKECTKTISCSFTAYGFAWSLFAANNDTLLIFKTAAGKTELKRFRVSDDHEYTYKIMTPNIKAANGSHGFVSHCNECIDSGFACNCWVYIPVMQIFENVKPIKA